MGGGGRSEAARAGSMEWMGEILEVVAVGFADGLHFKGQGEVAFVAFETLGFNH